MKPIVKTRLIAHRGLSGFECENTAAAFVAAGNRDYFGIETDVRRTADGQFVVLHDNTTGRVAQRNLTVSDATLAELRELQLKDLPRTPATTRADLRIPTLEEYLDICKQYKKAPVLELKERLTPDTAQEILSRVERRGVLSSVVFISFSWESLVELRKRVPQTPMQFLTGEYSSSLLSRLSAQNFDLDIYYPALNEERIRTLHDNGILVNLWTLDDVVTAKRFASWGTDFITTNRILFL